MGPLFYKFSLSILILLTLKAYHIPLNCTIFSFEIIHLIEPIGGEITVACESGMVINSPKTAMEKALDEQLRTRKFSASTSGDKSKKRGCYYTSIPRVIKRRGVNGEELTSLNLDKVSICSHTFLSPHWSLITFL